MSGVDSAQGRCADAFVPPNEGPVVLLTCLMCPFMLARAKCQIGRVGGTCGHHMISSLALFPAPSQPGTYSSDLQEVHTKQVLDRAGKSLLQNRWVLVLAPHSTQLPADAQPSTQQVIAQLLGSL